MVSQKMHSVENSYFQNKKRKIFYFKYIQTHSISLELHEGSKALEQNIILLHSGGLIFWLGGWVGGWMMMFDRWTI